MATSVLFIIVSVIAVSVAVKAPTWCAVDSLEMRKCQKWAKNLIGGQLNCVKGKSAWDCQSLIAKGQADMAAFDGGDIYVAGKNFNLKPIMTEVHRNSPDKTSSYYAVAVVRSGTKWTLRSLRNAASCHTGVKKTSGWNAPIGYLLSNGIMPLVNCSIFQSVAEFFSGSCAPGADNPHYNPGLVAKKKLCKNCIGNGNNKFVCNRGSHETYYGYLGALRCLQERAGDVAFIKHSILNVLENPSDYKLLCNNTRKALSEYKTCHLLKAPAHAVLTSEKKSAKTIKAYQDLLALSADRFRGSGKGTFRLLGDGVLFSRSTYDLAPLEQKRQSYRSYLGINYIKMVEALKGCKTM